MPSAHLSKNYLDSAGRPLSGVARHWDTEVKGFVAYVQPKATLYYQRDVHGKTKRILLGRYPTLSISSARTAARTFDFEMRSGKAKLLRTDEVRLKDALANYIATTEATEQHTTYVKRALEYRLSDWLPLPLPEITMPMIAARHRALSKDGLSMADDTLRAFRTVWNSARIDFPHASISSCPTDVLTNRKGKRSGWNNPAPRRNQPVVDLAGWHKAVNAITNPVHRGFYLFALLTACRKTEVMTLCWDQIDQENRLLHLPRTKSGREHFLPLNHHHLAVLDELPRHEKFVFPDRSWEQPLVEPRHPEVPGTLHALRHTWASVAAEIGFDEGQIGRILNHAHSARTITSRYVHVQVNALRPIMDAVTDEIALRLTGAGSKPFFSVAGRGDAG